MGNNEDPKPENPHSAESPQNQSKTHVYPDWAAIQAYYGPQVAVPPYVNCAVSPGHAPHHYMWGPLQPMMPPYGVPYAGIYAHGVYAHPGVPIEAASLNMDTSSKSSSKLKGFNVLGMSIGNCSVNNGNITDHGPSQSGQTEGSSDGSNTHSAGVGEVSKKRSRETTPNTSADGNGRIPCSPEPTREANGASEKETFVAVSPGKNIAEKAAGTGFSPQMATIELRNPGSAPVKVARITPSVHDENERELKREKRKQSNRESARRSRLRKQAEAEELATRVQSLTSENLTLKSEIDKFIEDSKRLKVENAALLERLMNKQREQKEAVTLGEIDDKRLQPVSTADLLARVNNSGPLDRTNEDCEIHEKNNASGAKLHQLLDAGPRTDAVAAR